MQTQCLIRFAALVAMSLSMPAGAVDVSEWSKLSLYEANHEKYVVLAIAANAGRSSEVVDRVKQSGGRVDYVRSDIDYLAAVLPLDRVRAFLDEAAIESVAFDNYPGRYLGQLYGWEAEPWQPPRRDASKPPKPISPVQQPRADWPPPLQAPNLDRPYDILQDMDGVAFRQRDARNDGRGVVIAHVERAPDLLLPELQTALDASGKAIPKLLDVINVPAVAATLDANAGMAGEYWTQRLSAPIRSRDGRIDYQGATYVVPKDSTYLLTKLNFTAIDTGVSRIYEVASRQWPVQAQPVSAAEAAKGIVMSFAVLWSDAQNKAWLDTDLDGDFSDEAAVALYRSKQTPGVLGQDDPATAVRETIGYALQKEGDYLSFYFGIGGHASLVAGAAAANKSPNGRIDGVAPAAQLLIVGAHANDSIAALARGLIVAFSHPRVDVVLIEGNLYTSGAFFRPKNGSSLPATVLSRLQRKYSKPTFVTADNMTGLTMAQDLAIPDDVIAVGAYQSADSIYANLGLHQRYRDSLHWVGAEGPSGSGALKPDLLAPATPMSVDASFRFDRDSARRFGIFELPPGYGICGGTSCATPVAAGAAALLVGAARRENLSVDAQSIQRALRESARYLANIDLYQQGRGVLQIDGAWRQLQAMNRSAPLERIEVIAPVRSVTSRLLKNPDTGTGLFEREGWQPGMRQVREITLVRKTGPRAPVEYSLSWQTEQNAFHTRDQVALPLNVPVTLPVEIAVDAPRVYSTLLEIGRDGVGGAVATVPMTVVVPHLFTAAAGYQWTETFELDRPGRRNLFFAVPDGAAALRVDARSARGDAQVRVHGPDNLQLVDFAILKELSSTQGSAVLRPMAGVWQVAVSDWHDSRNQDPSLVPAEVLPPSSITLTVSIHGVDVRNGAGHSTLTNKFAAIDGSLLGTALAAARSREVTVRAGERIEQTIDIPEGTTLILADASLMAGAADVDLFLYDCTGVHCASIRRADANGRDKRIVVENPKPGRWKTVLAARGDGQARVRYGEALVQPSLGSLSSSDTVAKRESGATWQVDWQVWQRRQPAAGYELAALFRVGLRNVHTRFALTDSFTDAPEAAALLEVVPVRDLMSNP